MRRIQQNLYAAFQALTFEGCKDCSMMWVCFRTGMIKSASVDNLGGGAERSYNRQIVWQQPTRPVLCAFNSAGSRVHHTDPATPTHLGKTLALAGDLIGSIQTAANHDLRHGSAAGIFNLSEPLRGSIDQIALLLKHSPEDKYIVRIKEDSWRRRGVLWLMLLDKRD